MAYTIEDLGIWQPYTPDVISPEAQAATAMGLGVVVFLRRESDGRDWYEFRDADGSFTEGGVLACALFDPGTGLETVDATQRDERMIFPAGQRLLEITGVPADDEKPFKLFKGKVYDPATNTIVDPPEPQAKQVTSAQALIQLSRMPHDGSVVPGTDNLLDATEALVAASPDRELKTWFARSQTWRIDNPNVLKIGTAFKLTKEEIQAAFNAASKIEE
jgi:hypothetical protein